MSYPSTQPSRHERDLNSRDQSERPDPLDQDKPPLSDEAVANLVGFIICVREILDDLRAKGYNIQNGHVIPPDQTGERRPP